MEFLNKSIKMRFIIKKLLKYRLFRFILYTIILFLIYFLINSIGFLIYMSMTKNKMKEDFTDKELTILENEFGFTLSENEKVDYARCLLEFHTAQAQVWITNVKNPKEFVKNNLHLSFKNFINSKFQPYSKSEGRNFYNDTNYDTYDEKNTSYIKGLKYKKKQGKYVVQIYKLPSEETYTVTIFKSTGFKSKEIWDIF